MDPEMRAALDELREDLRGEIRAGDAETRAYVDTRLAALSLDMGEWRAAMRDLEETQTAMRRDLAETQAAMRRDLAETQMEMRRHFDVVAESIRADVRVFAEALGLAEDRTGRRFGAVEQRVDRLEGQVLKIEARVSTIEKPRRRPRRRR